MSARTRGDLYSSHLRWSATVAVQLIAVAAALWVLSWVIGATWVVLLPIALALLVSTVLAPPVAFLVERGWPRLLAVFAVLLLAFGVVAGLVAAIAPAIVSQAGALAAQASAGVVEVRNWLGGPPFNIDDAQLDSVVTAVNDTLNNSSAQIASGVFTGVGAVGSALVTTFTAIVVTFFVLKDGPKFLPWFCRTVGRPAAPHVATVLSRVWTALGGFIRTQAIVSFVDALFIGIGLLILGVPLAPALAILTFIAGFIPIVGAVVAGGLAVLVALVANGPVTALIVLGIILAVQQIEGNVLQPWLQSKSTDLPAVVVLLAVTLGGSTFGIIGAFLAVPVVAAWLVVLRYYFDQVRRRTDDDLADTPATAEESDGAPDGGVSEPGGTR